MDSETGRSPKTGARHRTEIFRGRHFSFVTEEHTLPNGRRAEMAMVRHPGSVGIVPLVDERHVLMEHQYRPCIGETLIEIPAGTLEPGESPRDCAARELEEETGYRAAEFIDLGRTHILPAYSDELIHLFIAGGLTLTQPGLDPDEIIGTQVYPLERLMDMIRAGGITDALTVLALQRTWFWLHGVSGSRRTI